MINNLRKIFVLVIISLVTFSCSLNKNIHEYEKNNRKKSKSNDKTNSEEEKFVLIAPKEEKLSGYKEIGIASWYGRGDGFHGRKTANGEKFDRRALTAAHPYLPLNSKVLITNLENKKSIKLKINDRGPFTGNRIIDISEKAAEEIGIKTKGYAKVMVEHIKTEEHPFIKENDYKKNASNVNKIYVQLGIFSSKDQADKELSLYKKRYKTRILKLKTKKKLYQYKSLVGPFNQIEADIFLNQINKNRHRKAIIIKI